MISNEHIIYTLIIKVIVSAEDNHPLFMYCKKYFIIRYNY
jgi:hypothetical protein